MVLAWLSEQAPLMLVLFLLMRGRTPEALQAYEAHMPHQPGSAQQAALEELLRHAAQLLPLAQAQPATANLDPDNVASLQDFLPNFVADAQEQQAVTGPQPAHGPTSVVQPLLFGSGGAAAPAFLQLDRMPAAPVAAGVRRVR